MNVKLYRRLCLILSAISLAGTAVAAFPEKPLARQLMASAVFVRETKDQEWHIRVQGSLPCGPGLYVVVLNQELKAVFQGEIPFGDYSEEKPLTLTVPADGVAGDYAIKLVGQQDNLMGLRLPLTDLPLEVYGETGFALGYGSPGQARRVAFKTPAGKEDFVVNGWRAHYRILKADGSVLVDSKTSAIPEDSPGKHFGKGNVEIHVRLAPGETYWIDPYEILYFGFKDPAYLTFDPDRWFAPTFSLVGVKWWKEVSK